MKKLRKKRSRPQVSAKKKPKAQKHSIDVNHAYMKALKYKKKGNLFKAKKLFGNILKTAPEHVGSLYSLALITQMQGDHAGAIPYYEQVVSLDPEFAPAFSNLGVAYKESQQYQKAELIGLAAIKLEPRSAEARNNLGVVYSVQRLFDRAIDVFQETIVLEPGNVQAHYNLATCHLERGDLDSARSELIRVLQLAPDHSDAKINLMNVDMQSGQHELAEKTCRDVLDFDAGHVLALTNLTLLKRYEAPDAPEAIQMKALLERPDIAVDDQVHLHFALGKISDDCQQYDQAFLHYERACHLKRQGFEYDPDWPRTTVDRYIEVFSAELIEEMRRNVLDESRLPVFVVGMPRSGTSLVEQILASHPSIYGADELMLMDEICAELHRLSGSTEAYPETVRTMDGSGSSLLAGRIVQHLRDLRNGEQLHVIDKNPLNFFNVGLLALLFAQPLIIHCQRHPLDVCLSNFFQLYGKELPYTYSLKEVGLFFQQYKRLMAHWQEVLPVEICTIDYDVLVENPEDEIRRLLGFLGLSWDPACLSFHQTQRRVSTASNWQVRQPLYQRSRHRWRHYADHLQPLLEMFPQD